MKKNLFTAGLLIMLISCVGTSYSQPPTLHALTVVRYSPKLDALVSKDATIETIATDLDWCEGPLWVEQEQMLLFSDVPRNVIYKWTQDKGKEVYLKPSGYTGTIPRGGELGSNGLALTNNGRLLICQDGDRKISVMKSSIKSPKARFKALASSYQGKKFNSPNDMSVAANGDIYFTDPPYGLEKNMADPLKEMTYQGVFKITKSGKVSLLTDTIERPNGIAVFPDGKSILIANSFRQKPFIYKYDIDSNGKLKNGRIFYDGRESSKTEKGSCDGLKIDSKGNVYATTPGGVSIISQGGELLGRIKIDPVSSNCSLSGDEKTLYVTADDHVVKVRLRY